MRIYVPATAATLRDLLDTGAVGGVGDTGAVAGEITAFAVTSALREWYTDDDPEALEYAALTEAARASLRLLDAAPDLPSRRVVLAADVADDDLVVRDDLDRGVVRVRGTIPMAAVAAVHVDDAEAEPTVRAAVAAIVAADLGDPVAEDAVTDAEGYELAWYANQEIAAILDGL